MEEWKPYKDYEVSNFGRVKGKLGKILKTCFNGGGYLYVCICENGKRKNMKIHRLVALCFIPNPDNKPQVDHINRDKTDNRVENLRWATRSENQINIGIRSDNKCGHKYIYTTSKKGREYWVIEITYLKIRKLFSKTKYTLEYVVTERDKLFKTPVK